MKQRSTFEHPDAWILLAPITLAAFAGVFISVGGLGYVAGAATFFVALYLLDIAVQHLHPTGKEDET